jgi:hypothetical protein
LSDFNKEVSTAYGSLYESLLGFRGIAKRSVFVIDKSGTVQYAWISEEAGKLLSSIRFAIVSEVWMIHTWAGFTLPSGSPSALAFSPSVTETQEVIRFHVWTITNGDSSLLKPFSCL